MGLAKGTFTFSRFRIETDPAIAKDGDRAEQLRKNAFLGLPEKYHEKALGWSVLDNPLEDDISTDKITFGDYLAFCLRIDRREPSPALVKIKTLEAEKSYLAEKGLKRLPKALLLEIREAVQEKLKRLTQPVPTFFDLYWDPQNSIIFFGSLADRAIEDFDNFFKESFGLRLSHYLPEITGEERAPAQPMNDQIGISNENSSNRVETKPDEVSLRRDFLTWLWFKAEEKNGTVALPGGKEIEVSLGQRLVLTSGDGEYIETLVCQGRYSDHKEARVGLSQGKRIKEARIGISHDSMDWEFTLKADRLQFQSVKLPVMAADEEESPQGQLLERIYLIQTLTDYVDSLYRLFLKIRQSPDWLARELPLLERVLAR
ncbi:MAG: hypothetical protein U1C55_09305 [Smithellaceae bacterium]|nr:hypothetical protein [Smithellaceae bacterium]